MNFTFLHRPDVRKFNYKPQFYVPEEKKPTNEKNFNPDMFGEKLRSSWDRRRHKKDDSSSSRRTIIWMVFIILLLGLVAYKFLFKLLS